MIAVKDVSLKVEVEKPVLSKGFLNFVYMVVIFMIIGAGIPLVFWGLWYIIYGSIPKILGFSRLWLDAIPGPVYVLIFIVYYGELLDQFDDFLGGDEYGENISAGNNWDFVKEYWQFLLLGVIIAVDFLASVFFFSLAAGLAGFVALLAVVYICRGIRRLSLSIYYLFLFAVFCFCKKLCSLWHVCDIDGGPT